VYYNEVLLH